jgi:hypothetical protein
VLKGDHLRAALFPLLYFVLLCFVVSVLLLLFESLVFVLVHLIVHLRPLWDYWSDIIFSFHVRFFLECLSNLTDFFDK